MQVLEGTWEEVMEQARQLAREHAGERVRLVVIDDVPGTDAATLRPQDPSRCGLSVDEKIRMLDELAEQNRGLPVLPPEAFERESIYEDRW